MMSLVPVKSRESELTVPVNEWAVLKEQCSMLVRSGFLPTSVKTPEQAIAIALKGRELGVAPMQAFAQINVIQGKPAISAELQLALIYRNVPGAKVDFESLTNEGCSLITQRPGHKPVRISFDKKDAESAQLLGKDNWKKYPRAMYRSRAISEMARTVYPDAIMGCSYTAEELGAITNEDGDVIEMTIKEPEVLQVSPPPPQSEEQSKKKGYDGSKLHQDILKKTLLERHVPEDFWSTIDTKMLGKSFTDLETLIREVCI